MDARIAQLVTNVDTRLACRGPESDVVFSSRVRLARNLAGYPFVDRLSVFDREKIISSFTEASAKLLEPDSYLLLGASELQQADLLCLLERQLISREFLDGEAERAARKRDIAYMKRTFPDTVFVELKGQDHAEFFSLHPEAFCEQLETFLLNGRNHSFYPA